MIVVQIDELQDFIDEITDSADRVVNKTVRWQIRVQPEQKENISRRFAVWATVIIDSGIERELLEYAKVVGRDSSTTGINEGSQEASRQRAALQEACKAAGLKLRHGKIEGITDIGS